MSLTFEPVTKQDEIRVRELTNLLWAYPCYLRLRKKYKADFQAKSLLLEMETLAIRLSDIAYMEDRENREQAECNILEYEFEGVCEMTHRICGAKPKDREAYTPEEGKAVLSALDHVASELEAIDGRTGRRIGAISDVLKSIRMLKAKI